MAGLTIQEMRLSNTAEQAALIVLKMHPFAWFTSGKRDIMDQARVMAQNAIRHGSAWLDSTYRDKRIVRCLMTHMEENPGQCSDPKVLAHAFYEQLQENFGGELTKFPHVRGDAFDIAWPKLKSGLIDRPSGELICTTIERLPIDFGIPLDLLLRKEGKLDVIHAQFRSAPMVQI
jgi:hypothetical protein